MSHTSNNFPSSRILPRHLTIFLSLTIFLGTIGNSRLTAQNQGDNLLSIQPADRITGFINDEQRITLRGNRHPMALPQFDAGAVSPDFPMERMILGLRSGSEQEAALAELIEAQHSPESPYYHQWLTPQQYAERFGLSDSDIAQVAAWLTGHGLVVEEISAGRRSIVFSGTAAQVKSAFHTEIHAYQIGGELHHANASDPEIPIALSPVIAGIVSLHDFRSQPMHRALGKPDFTAGNAHFLAPADFATIYDLSPLYQQSINGTGESIAIVGRSNINLSDVVQFRSYFELPANNPQIIVNGPDPGVLTGGEETEADLDVEWSGAVAPHAGIRFVVSKSTNSSDGVYLSAQYIVNHNLAPLVSTSFGLCEAALGSSGNAFLDSLWQQAAAQGISVFVSSGDSGAAGCDSPSETTASHGLGVNGLCSTPYSICVGGTEFSDSNASLYWSSSNTGTQGSALGYIPEVAWNESGTGSGLWASGGGASAVYVKPSWQAGKGVPADGRRDVPDVALTAAGHDGYMIVQNGGLYIVAGTSASSPSFAGIMALAVQNAAARLGNANTFLYTLASKQDSGGASVFHDIVLGNNSVPGQAGFNAGAGYDRVTGLGSVDAAVLVNHWSDGVPPNFHLTSATSISVSAGSSNSMNLTVSVSGGFSAPVGFSITGLPKELIATFTPATLSAPGGGSSTLKLAAPTGTKAGSYTVTVSATGGGITQRQSIGLTINGGH